MNVTSIHDLDAPLMMFPSEHGIDYFTARNAFEGVQIFGGIGGGKTTGSGQTFALKYLAAGWGGLILTAKPDELDLWKEYCRLTDRLDDLVVIEPGGASFNFLDYELEHRSGGVTPTANIVEVLNTVIAAGAAHASGKTDDAFWQSSLESLIHNTIDLCRMAYDRLSIEDMHKIVLTMPKEGETRESQDEPNRAFNKAMTMTHERVVKQIDPWEKTLTIAERERMADDEVYNYELENAIADARLARFIDSYFWDTLFRISDKTRSIIDMMFSSFLLQLLREPFYSLFCRHPSTVTPDDCLNGKVVVVNLPVKLHNKAGRDAQMLVKYCFQRAWERRDIRQSPNPVFLWADEAQLFLHEKDADFQATARSSRVATVYLSQNLPNYMASMGGAKPEYKVKSFLGTLGTKFFHANADTETNNYGSALIGDGFFINKTGGTTLGESFSQNFNRAHELGRLVRPEEFVRLRTGGPKNNHRVEAYMHRQGEPFASGFNHMLINFTQHYRP
jgi:hypothetical protein